MDDRIKKHLVELSAFLYGSKIAKAWKKGYQYTYSVPSTQIFCILSMCNRSAAT